MSREESNISGTGGGNGVEAPSAFKEAMELLQNEDDLDEEGFEGFTIDSDDEIEVEINLQDDDNTISVVNDAEGLSTRKLNKETVNVAEDPLQSHSLVPPVVMEPTAAAASTPSNAASSITATKPSLTSSSRTGSNNRLSFASTLSNFAKTAANSIQDAMNNASSSAPPPQHQPQPLYPQQQPAAPSSQIRQSTAAMNGNLPQQTVIDNAQKSSIITSAIGDLLPGEKIIMFLTHLTNVSDSSSPQSGVGSVWSNEQNDLIWCCAMTFYRVVVFSYFKSDFEENASSTAQTDKMFSPDDAQNLMKTASVSRQFQYYHASKMESVSTAWNQGTQDDNEPSTKKKFHYVTQMPLASIERVEKCTDYISTSSSFSGQLGFNSSSTLAGSANSSVVANLGLIIVGKDNGRTIRFYTTSYGDCIRAYEALNTYAFPGRRNLGYLFAFESRRAEVMASLQNPPNENNNEQLNNRGIKAQPRITARATPRRFEAFVEFERMGILRDRSLPVENATGTRVIPSPWRPLVKANANYTLCPSYPSILIGPHAVNDDTTEGLRLMKKVASFRSEGRMPTLAWGSRHDGASIWRSSQPKVGLQGNRSPHDEKYLRLIAECAGAAKNPLKMKKPSLEFIKMLTGCINENDLNLENFKTTPHIGSKCRMKIFDLRPKTSAVANRTGGYGYENTSYYTNMSLSFHGIGNIHAVRDSYQKLSALCMNEKLNDVQWTQLVEDTKWLQHIRLILSCSWQTAFHVRYNRLPVLLHCSHGWDRTSQVSALAQLLLDPFYRTRAGFSCLVEKEFMSLGHPFHTRCGHGEGRGERGGGVGSSGVQSSGDEGQLSPIFLQFLDCAFQIVNQYPDFFEFNTKYLLLLTEHVYSCLFGTLLCDTERERELVATIRQRTHCLWEYLDSIPGLVNQSFSFNCSEGDDIEECGALLMPLPCLLRNVTLWVDRHCMHSPRPTLRCLPLKNSLFCTGDSVSGDIKFNGQIPLYSNNDFVEAQNQNLRKEADKWKMIAEAKEKEIVELKLQVSKQLASTSQM